ncbi:MAG: NAD(+)/NADH kinase [Thermoguttaceae bacterium]|nr:NAD(+)/NADH kinase [Thermoguttaceae bacterium]
MMKTVLLGNGGRPGVLETVKRLTPQLKKRLKIETIDLTGQVDLSSSDAELAIVFGGDGSLLRSIHQLGRRQIPLLPVNVGTLAFLSALMPDELIPFLDSPGFRSFTFREHILLECVLWRRRSDLVDDGTYVSEEVLSRENEHGEVPIAHKMVVNEVVIQGGPPFEILNVELAVDGLTVATYHGDGLIVSTPTGSTAHNLSSGGPILRRDLNAVVVSPISPHSLSYRPVVDSADRLYELRVVNRPVFVVVDGDSDLTMLPGDRVEIRKAPFAARLIRIPGKNYYKTLREKLGWSDQPRAQRDSARRGGK